VSLSKRRADRAPPLIASVRPHSSRTLTLHYKLLLTLCALTACSSQDGVDEQFLRCKGKVTTFMTGEDPLVEEDQEIAAHIKRSTISFSGNAFWFEQDMPICSPTRGGNVHSESYFYFHSPSCDPLDLHARNATYGTYNWVLSKLQVTNTSLGADMPIKGTFTCVKVDSTN